MRYRSWSCCLVPGSPGSTETEPPAALTRAGRGAPPDHRARHWSARARPCGARRRVEQLAGGSADEPRRIKRRRVARGLVLTNVACCLLGNERVLAELRLPLLGCDRRERTQRLGAELLDAMFALLRRLALRCVEPEEQERRHRPVEDADRARAARNDLRRALLRAVDGDRASVKRRRECHPRSAIQLPASNLGAIAGSCNGAACRSCRHRGVRSPRKAP